MLDSFRYRTLQVEVATACNLDCAICLRKGIGRPNRFLSLSDFKSILDPGLFLSPWYGVTSPSWFSLYGLLALFALGIWVELLFGKWDWVGGGLGNLFCLGITWLAFGLHRHIWADAKQAPLPLLAAFISGVAGVLLARIIVKILPDKTTKRSY